jgi:hypothetical protein
MLWRIHMTPVGVKITKVGSSVQTFAQEKHVGVPELSRRWGFSEDVVRRWFLETPRPGVLRHSERKRGKRAYISLRISESAAAEVYAEKCGCRPGLEYRFNEADERQDLSTSPVRM